MPLPTCPAARPFKHTFYHTNCSLSVGSGKLGQANRYDSPPAYCRHSLAVKLLVPSLLFRLRFRLRRRCFLLFQRQVGTGHSIERNIPNILPPLRTGEVAVSNTARAGLPGFEADIPQEMVLSLLPDAKVLPSGLKATLNTGSVWPVKGGPRGSRLATSHKRMVLS